MMLHMYSLTKNPTSTAPLSLGFCPPSRFPPIHAYVNHQKIKYGIVHLVFNAELGEPLKNTTHPAWMPKYMFQVVNLDAVYGNSTL